MPIPEKTRQSRTYVTDENEQLEIDKFIRLLESQFRENHRATLTSATGEVIELPATLFDVLRQVAESLASGRGVSVIPQDTKLTTQQAAEFLGVSRPTLIKLLESDAIPFETVGRHRRVTLSDLLFYKNDFRLRRRTTLRQAARAGQEAGLLESTAEEMPPRS